MRGVLYVLAALAVIGLGFWAYTENHKTREEVKQARVLHSQIGAAHERLNMLQAEWAYLNRPDRLRDLAELNFDRLGLLPLMPDAFGDMDDIIDPIPEILPIINPIDVSSVSQSTEEDPL